MKSKTLKIIKNDPWLEPYRQAIEGRYNYALSREKSLTKGGSLSEFANGHLFFAA